MSILSLRVEQDTCDRVVLAFDCYGELFSFVLVNGKDVEELP